MLRKKDIRAYTLIHSFEQIFICQTGSSKIHSWINIDVNYVVQLNSDLISWVSIWVKELVFKNIFSAKNTWERGSWNQAFHTFVRRFSLPRLWWAELSWHRAHELPAAFKPIQSPPDWSMATNPLLKGNIYYLTFPWRSYLKDPTC